MSTMASVRRRRRAPTATAVAALLATSAASASASASAASPRRRSESNLSRPIRPGRRDLSRRDEERRGQRNERRQRPRRTEKGVEPRHRRRRDLAKLNKLKDSGNNNKTAEGLNKLKAGVSGGGGGGGGGAFNPALLQYDPNSAHYGKSPEDLNPDAAASESWSPCPDDDPTFAGNRASHDCLSYVYCSGGAPQGGYSSCMGLKFDNGKGTCTWTDEVHCEGTDANSDGGGGIVGGSASQMTVVTTNSAGSAGNDAVDVSQGWSGGNDWGGRWVNGEWVPDGDSPTDLTDGWTSTVWDPSEIIPFPPHPILPSHQLESGALDPTTATNDDIPREYSTAEGWSILSRSKSANGGRKTIVGYYAGWKAYGDGERAKPENMNFQKVDRVNYAFFQADERGHVWGTDAWADPIILFGPHDWGTTPHEAAGNAPQFYEDNGFDDSSGPEWNYVGANYVDLGDTVRCHRATPTGRRDCHSHKVREGLIGRVHEQGALIYPSVGGWSLSEVFPKIAADGQARRNFAKNCVGLVREYGFDGIDIDWEFPGYAAHGGGPDDVENWVLLLQDIRSALDAYASVTYPNGERNFGLTAALPCGPSVIDYQDVPKVSEILTELNLMSYDFHGTWDDVVMVNSPLYDQPDEPDSHSPEKSVRGCVERWIDEGADPAKINVGVPFYGRSFGAATRLYQDFDGPDGIHWHVDDGQPQYHDILEKLPDMISLRDDATRTQFAYFPDDGGIVSFDDGQAVCDKVEYARENDLHGYLVWELSGDLTEDLMTPLLDVMNFKLDQGDGFDCELFRLESRDEDGNVVGLDDGKDNLWYANWESGACINDGKQSAWEKEDNLFRFKEECCGYKFEYRFDDCVGPPTYPPSKRPTKRPTASPIVTGQPTDNPTHTFGAAQVIGGPKTPSPISRNAEIVGPAPPETWCLGGCDSGLDCVGNQNHPQQIADDDCKPCQSGQTYWPCDVDGLCFCWDPDSPRIPPAPGSGLAQLSDEPPCGFFTQAMFDALAPDAAFPYTHDGLCTAIDSYNEHHAEKIFMMGTDAERRSELAAFLGHTLHESDEWKASREYLMCADQQVSGGTTYCKPCDSSSFNWETFTCDGPGLAGGGLTFNGYCDRTIEPPAACTCDDTLVSEPAPLEGYIPASKVFFGRGAIQLSWNYNFRAASEALTGDPSTFCEDPDLVATTPEYAWGAGVFFWMENLKEETTCHIEALKFGDFGGTLNNINGGLECPAYHGGWHGGAIKLRLNRYCKASAMLNLDHILILDGCKELNNSFAECLGDGSCPDCEQYRDGSAVSLIPGPATVVSEATPVVAEPTPSEPARTPDPTPDPTPNPTPNPTPEPVEAATGSETIVASNEAQSLASTELDTSRPTCPPDMQPVDGLPNCCVPEPAYHGDGACDPDTPYNTAECDFDGGDCCQETCDLESTYGCSAESFGYGPFGYFCINESLDEYIDPDLCTVSDRTRVGDGRCDAGVEMYNTEACQWDGGDCCEDTCNPRYAYFTCGDPTYPYDCQNPTITQADLVDTRPNAAISVTSPVDPSELLAESEPSVITVISSDDSFIMKGSPDSNHGAESVLKVKGLSTGPNAHDSIVKFNIPAYSGTGLDSSTPVDATLRLYSLRDSNYGGIFHLASDTTSWSEADVTWNTAPSLGARIGSLGQVQNGRWYTMDVSEAVGSLNGNGGEITVRIRSRDVAMTEYSSKEGINPPEITVTYYGVPQASAVADPEPIPVTPAPSKNPTPQPTKYPTSRPTHQPLETVVVVSPLVSDLNAPDGHYILTPSDDATIVAENPGQNYGSDKLLQVDDDSGVYDSMIRFDTSDIDTRAIASATLRIFCMDGSDSGGIVGRTISADWNEDTVSWSNAPAGVGSPLANMGSVQTETWYESDVTYLFSRSKDTSLDAVSIRITSNSWNRAKYSSKEGPYPPQLVIQMDEDSLVEINAQSNQHSNAACAADVHPCPDGSFVSRVPEDGCNFAPCLGQAMMDSGTGTGLFFPVWGPDGAVACIDETAPSWAKGAYLKESKSDCCEAFFLLQVDECLGS